MIMLLNVYIYTCPQEEQCTSSSWGYSKIYTPGTTANLQTDRVLTKINKNGTAVRLRILVELGILTDIYRVISN